MATSSQQQYAATTSTAGMGKSAWRSQRTTARAAADTARSPALSAKRPGPRPYGMSIESIPGRAATRSAAPVRGRILKSTPTAVARRRTRPDKLRIRVRCLRIQPTAPTIVAETSEWKAPSWAADSELVGGTGQLFEPPERTRRPRARSPEWRATTSRRIPRGQRR